MLGHCHSEHRQFWARTCHASWPLFQPWSPSQRQGVQRAAGWGVDPRHTEMALCLLLAMTLSKWHDLPGPCRQDSCLSLRSWGRDGAAREEVSSPPSAQGNLGVTVREGVTFRCWKGPDALAPEAAGQGRWWAGAPWQVHTHTYTLPGRAWTRTAVSWAGHFWRRSPQKALIRITRLWSGQVGSVSSCSLAALW